MVLPAVDGLLDGSEGGTDQGLRVQLPVVHGHLEDNGQCETLVADVWAFSISFLSYMVT